MIAQHVKERRVRLGVDVVVAAVDVELHWRASSLPGAAGADGGDGAG